MEEDIIMRSDAFKDLEEFSKAIVERVDKSRKAMVERGDRPYATHSGIEVAWDPEKKDFVVFAQRVLFCETPEEAEFDRTFKQKNMQKVQAVAQKTAQGSFFPQTTPQQAPPQQPAQQGQYAPQTDAQGRVEIAAAWRDKKMVGMLSLKSQNGQWFKVAEASLKNVNGEITYTHEESGKVTVFVPTNSQNPKAPVYRVFAHPDGGAQ